MNADIPELWQFGEFRLDVRRKILRHRDTTVAMPLKELEVLSILVRNQGELVTKDEIVEEIWQDSFVDESNLTRHIYLLRKTLKDLDAGSGQLIENVPRRGYRFTGDVTPVHLDEIVVEKHTRTRTRIEIQNKVRTNRFLSRFKQQPLIYVGLTVLLVATAAFFGSQYLQGPTSLEIKSIAVLPFKTIDSAGGNSHAGIGLADVLITRLSNIRELNIRPTSAVIGLYDTDSRAAGEKLQVDAVLEGTIVYAGDRVRVTTRLIRIFDGSTIWTGEFEKLRSDELEMQNELALQIVKTMALNLSTADKEALAKRYTDSADAFELYARGRYEWSKRTAPAMIEAQRLFGNAIEADPSFALAYVGLADSLATGQSDEARTWSAITRALELDPSLAEAHASRGFYLMFFGRNWHEAEKAFKRSLELNPNYPTAHHWYATLLAIRGEFDQAKAEMHRALALDPLSHNFLADLGQIHYFAGEYAEAEKYCRRSLEIYPDFAFAHQYLYYVYLKTGDYDRAVEEIIRAEAVVSTLDNSSANYREARLAAAESARRSYREGGIRGSLEHRYAGSPHDPGELYFYAIKHAFLGQNEKALDYLERSTDAGMFMSAFVKAEPLFDGLRSEPRYQEILRKMGLA